MKQALVFALCCSSVFALEEDPWLGNAYEWNFFLSQAYSRYRWIDQAKEQIPYAYNNYVTDFDLSFTMQDLAFSVEWEMARTPHQTYGFRSGALGARYRLFDDIAGDALSLALGASLRGVTGRAVRDVSSPYSSYLNAEMLISAGKEFVKREDWTVRGYIAGYLGLANHGSCWNRFSASLETKFLEKNAMQFFTLGYFGYGPQKEVEVTHFHGWGKIRHGSLDLGGSYRYLLGIWGEVGISYAYRIFAYSYPQNTQTVNLFYSLPFSFF
jgi:hypothetical protein